MSDTLTLDDVIHLDVTRDLSREEVRTTLAWANGQASHLLGRLAAYRAEAKALGAGRVRIREIQGEIAQLSTSSHEAYYADFVSSQL